MKKLLFIFIITLPFIFSCGHNSEVEKLKAQNDSLRGVAKDNELLVEEFSASFAGIQENLNTIKEKEDLITLSTTSGGELSPDIKAQINEDITAIYQLMLENKQSLKSIKTRLKASGNKNTKLQNTIDLYAKQMDEKDAEITTLTTKLEQLNFDVENLNLEITDLHSDIDTLKDITDKQGDTISDQGNTIKDQDEKLHSVYYVYGTKTELKEHNIISKDGVLKGFELDDNFDKTYFTKVDDRSLTNIKLNAKKIEILTKHPANSYNIIEENNTITGIEIKDANQFWSITKYFVIMIK